MNNRVAYWRLNEPIGNFGDSLSSLLLGRLFRDCKEDFRVIHLIGSVISDYAVEQDLMTIPGVQYPIAFWGCGMRDHRPLSDNALHSCRFFGVRGSLSRKILGLPINTPLGDPGLLVKLVHAPTILPEFSVQSICIPHFEEPMPYRDIKLATGVDCVISPRVSGEGSITRLIDIIASAKFVLAGALHAAIVACALGTPFAYFNSGHLDIPFKWFDFSTSVDIPVVFTRNIKEGYGLGKR